MGGSERLSRCYTRDPSFGGEFDGMMQADDGSSGARPADTSHWFTGVSIAIVIIVCLVVFIVAFVQINPYLSDFVSEDDALPTPTAQPTTVPSPTSPAPTVAPDGTPEGVVDDPALAIVGGIRLLYSGSP
jgi:hypothetical protein